MGTPSRHRWHHSCIVSVARVFLPLTVPCTGSGGNASDFLAQITSYDYSAPISEAGGTGQPGIGGANKFQVQCTVLTSAVTGRVGSTLYPNPHTSAPTSSRCSVLCSHLQ